MSNPTENTPEFPQNGGVNPAGEQENQPNPAPAEQPQPNPVAPEQPQPEAPAPGTFEQPQAPQAPAAPAYAPPPQQAAPGHAPQYGQPQLQPQKGLAIASLVLGIVSIVMCLVWYLSVPAGVVGVILGFVAKSRKQPKNFWLWGIILGFVGLALSIIITIIALVVVTSMINEYGMQY